MTVIVQQSTDSNGNPQPMVYDSDTGKIIVDSNGYYINGGKRLVNVPTVSEYVSTPKTQTSGIQEAVNYAYQLALDSTTDSLSNYGTVYQTVYILKGIYICNEDITIPSNSSGASVSMLNGDINSNIFFTQNNAKGIVLDAFNGAFTIKNLNILYFPVGGSTSNYTGISLIHADWSAFPSGNTALFLHNVTMDDGYSKISSPSSTSGGLFANGAGSLIAYNLVLAAGNLLSVNNCTVVDFFNPQFSAGYYFSNNNTVLFMGGLVGYGIGFIGGYSVTFINTSLDASSSSQQMIFVSSVNILTVINATLTFYLTNQSVFLVGNGSSTNYSTGAIRVKGITVNMVNTTSTTPNTFKYGNFGTGGYQINPTALDVDVPTIVGYGSYITQYMVPTTPSVPTSGTAQQNTNQYPVDVYIYGGDVTEIQITKNGTAYTVLSVSTAIAMSGQAYKLNPDDSITVTYTTAPSWEWMSD